MKLVDILARELKEWPEGVPDLEQSSDGSVYSNSYHDTTFRSDDCYTKSTSWVVDRVTHAQWQAAVDALKSDQCAHGYANKHGCPECGETVSAAWDGAGLPPVGIEFEWRYGDLEWKLGEALYVGSVYVILKARDHEQHYYLRDMQFRPIRTPEQIVAAEARESAIKDLMQLNDIYHEQAAAIYDAGYRKVSP